MKQEIDAVTTGRRIRARWRLWRRLETFLADSFGCEVHPKEMELVDTLKGFIIAVGRVTRNNVGGGAHDILHPAIELGRHCYGEPATRG